MVRDLGGLTWIESGGGPLLLLSSEYLADWEGVDSPSNGRIVQATFRWNGPGTAATDYDRACDIDDYIAAIPVGSGTGLVLNQEPMPTTWQHYDDQIGGLLIRWMQGDAETDVLELLPHSPNPVWEPGHITFTVGSAPLYLFDAVSPGNELDEHLPIALSAGVYLITTALHKPDDRTSFVLHRFTRLDQ
jgi:hypothetical protein